MTMPAAFLRGDPSLVRRVFDEKHGKLLPRRVGVLGKEGQFTFYERRYRERDGQKVYVYERVTA